ncbi:hypothetical protein FIBSPDRAFT_955338 [Athelia psychrophila]|uniref:HMA domain-containing protein n=1 Tax=Athelia psychrophila TaxID=1759441 RepID=A0A166I1D8_9AGAM|nr:hypothetical protein FIBSPDRAFT_955338 [Fibularhizoctonia sp. CBS 109695]
MCAHIPYPADIYTILSTTMSAPEAHKYEFDVKMTCSGCSGAIDRVLKKLKDVPEPTVQDYTVDLDKQLVNVTGTIPYEDLLAKIKKTGKEVRSGKTIQ